MSETHAISATLRRDLALVLPSNMLDSKPSPALIEDAVIDRAARLISLSKSPAIVGIASLSIESTRAAVRLAEAMRGRLLPWPAPTDAGLQFPSVTQTASLGEALSCDLVIWVGGNGADNLIAEMLASHQLKAAFVPATLDAVLSLRSAVAKDPVADPFGRHRRITVAISADAQKDPRVLAQWHKLAAAVQQQCRVSVIEVPDLSLHLNTRGATEAVTWLTGVSPRRGGVDFSDGCPRQCPHLDTLAALGAIDLVIDMSPAPLPSSLRRVTVIRVGEPPANGNPGDMTIPLRSLAPGSASQVMRFDGQVLRLQDEPTTAAPDPVAAFFTQLAKRLTTH